MDDRELKALAEDIKANGLREPIQIDAAGEIVDGRNRYAACELAGVTPTFETVDGDVGDRIVSANIMRRHMTKGQIAIVAVIAETGLDLDASLKEEGHASFEKGQKYDYQRQAHNRVKNLVSAAVVEQAVAILNWAPDQAKVILDTGAGWNYGRELAATRKQQTSNEETRRRLMVVDSPELLAQVDDADGLSLDEAWQIRERRLAQEREKAVRMSNYLVTCVRPLLDKADFGTVEMVEYYDPTLVARTITVADVDEAIGQLQLIKREMKRLKKGLE